MGNLYGGQSVRGVICTGGNLMFNIKSQNNPTFGRILGDFSTRVISPLENLKLELCEKWALTPFATV